MAHKNLSELRLAVQNYVQGKRKIVKGAPYAAQLAEAATGLGEGETPYSIMLAVENAKGALRLSGNALKMFRVCYDATTKSIDFLPGNRAIVWMSQKTLMKRCGFADKKTYQRAARELVSHSLIHFKDSPSGRRYGQRHIIDGKKGPVIVAKTFGIDLTPACARRAELIKLTAAYELAQDYKALVREHFELAKQRLEGFIGYAVSIVPESALLPLYERFLRAKARYAESGKDFEMKERVVAMIVSIADRVAALISTAETQAPDAGEYTDQADIQRMTKYLKEMTPKGGHITPPIIPITRPHSKTSNRLSDEEVAERSSHEAVQGSIAKQWAKIRELEARGASRGGANTGQNEQSVHKMCKKPTFKHVRAGLPKTLRAQIRDDDGFFELYDLLEDHSNLHGISGKLLSYGRGRMGLENTCAALTTMIDKKNTIRSPEAYFQSLIKLHSQNRFKPSASLFGIQERRKEMSRNPQYGLDIA